VTSIATADLPRLPVRVLSPLLGAVCDATVALAFGRPGFVVRRWAFDPADLAVDLRGRVCLVTGANSGLGFATARALAGLGAEVWLLCRDEARGAAAAETIRRTVAHADVHLARIDLASLASVRACVEELRVPRVDALVHNAGVLPATRRVTADGLELTLATNVVGPFLLTHLLLPRLRAAAARIVTVSSGGMYAQRLSLDDLDWRRRPFDGVVAYAQTKRAEVVLSELWAERLAGTGVTANAMHPGWADTPSVRHSLPRFWRVARPILRSPEEGADTIVWLAASPRVAGRSGLFWLDRRPRATHLVPWTRERAEDRTALWALCRRLAGLGVGGLADARAEGA
jgi:NAD(P)-dependent dehydrogenase (short-subunit alcohol dehydrogenase family)